MAPALEVAKYLINSLSIDNLKLQKLLYYSQAAHLVLHNKKSLFPEPIEAWSYGPVIPIVYQEYKLYGFEAIQTTNFVSTLSSDEKESADISINLYGKLSGTDLIEQTHYELPWKNAYRPGLPSSIIPIDSIYTYFKDSQTFPTQKSPSYEIDSTVIKTLFFMNLKESINMIISYDKEINYSENPFVDVESISKKYGITDIKRVPSNTIFDKHAILIDSIIYIKENDNSEKQRFSIAHELFHFLTKWPRSDFIQAVARQGETWKKKNAGSAEAIEEEITDYFAANLLIPTERFILWEDKSDEEIAAAFGVEPKCIKKRREEIDFELEAMSQKNLSSNMKIEDTTPLTLDKLDSILEGSSTYANRKY